MEEQICSDFCVGEEAYGFATSTFGCCSCSNKSHMFTIKADKVGVELRKTSHRNAKGKHYTANYQMEAAMQQMDVRTTDIQTLCGFLDSPTSASCHHHIKQAETVLGPVQIRLQEESEKKAVLAEIELTKKHDGYKTHASTVEGMRTVRS